MNDNIRNSNIELLRIILMLMVISLHFNNEVMGGAFSVVSNFPARLTFLRFIEAISICAVNCFMIISGYFLAYNREIKISKIADLLLIVIFYRLLDYFLIIITGQDTFRIKAFLIRFIPMNYFAIFYLVTYIFTPFISLIFDSLVPLKQKYFALIVFFLFVFWPTIIDLAMDLIPDLQLQGASTISGFGNLEGYSIVQFVCALIIGAYIRRSNFTLKSKYLFIIYFICVFIITFGASKYKSLYFYCSIFTFISAISLFLLFNKISLKSNFINLISKSVFSIFCIHTSSFFIIEWKNLFITVEHLTNSNLSFILWFIISVLAMFIVCLILDLFMRITIGKVKKLICNKLNYSINFQEK